MSFDLRFIPFALVYCAYALTLLSRIFAISRLVVGMNFLLGQVVAEELPDPKGPRAHAPPLRYVAYCYAGCLAGWGPAYTSNGLAYALNFLQAKHPRVKKTYFHKTNSAKDFDTPCNIVGTLCCFFLSFFMHFSTSALASTSFCIPILFIKPLSVSSCVSLLGF